VHVPPFYAIVDADACARASRDPLAVARACLEAGVRIVQLRAKPWPAARLLDLADAVAADAAGRGATLIVNDRVDVAATVGAGVHLGQTDLPVAEARRLLGADAVIGRSTHTPDELAAALDEPVSYVAHGPVFATASKANPDPVIGLAGIAAAAAAAHARGLPLVAIGGITLATAADVRAAGADAVAVIGDLVAGSEDPAARARRFLSRLGGEGRASSTGPV
jgi:thiamine-phosphate diphosphorylase